MGSDEHREPAGLGAVLDAAPEVALYGPGDLETTAADLRSGAAALAGELRAHGVRPGHVVAVRLPNGPGLVVALFGVWAAGAVYTPLNPRATAAEVAASLAAVRPAALLDEAGVHTLDDPVLQPPGIALVQFTSGTTGEPKPVPLLHANVLAMIDGVVGSIRSAATAAGSSARPPMPNLVPLSLSLWAGLYQVLFAFRVGAPAVLMERFDTTTFARLVAQHGIRSTVLPPAALAMLSDDPAIHDLAPLRIVRSITAPLAPAQARRFHERFGVLVLNSYGQTELSGEVAGWSTADTREFGEAKLGSVGRPHPGVEIRADEASGELLVRTPGTASGATNAAMANRLLPGGWFRTGDLGRVDDDGFVWIDGRVSDAINRGGTKVFPAHVEDALLGHPDVRDVAVVGMPDDRLGEVPWAFVVPATGEPDDIDPASLQTWCRELLTPYKVPVRFVGVRELPRSEIGKVLKAELARRWMPAT